MTPPPGLPHLSDGMSGGTFQSMAAIIATEDAAGGHRPGGADQRRGRRGGGARPSPIALAPAAARAAR